VITKKLKILVIDDEPAVRRFLNFGLEPQGYLVEEADSGRGGIEKINTFKPDLIILDLGLPDIGGLEVLKIMRSWSKIPVIILTVRDSDADKVALLEAGADDYLTKPFSMAELSARVKVAQRHARAAHEANPIFKSERLEIDMVSKSVKLDGHMIHLTSTEFDLLRILVLASGRVVSVQNLVSEVWNVEGDAQVHYLRVYMGHLRKKLEVDPSNPTLILTEAGVGYRLKLDREGD